MRHLFLFVIASLFIGCSDPRGKARNLPTPATPDAGAAEVEASTPLNIDVPDSGSATDAACTYTCSPDLRSVISCDTGQVIMECPSGLGCGNGTCVPPCESAALNKSSVGCDYYPIPPSQHVEVLGACYAAYIANTSPVEVELKVEYAGKELTNQTDFARIPVGSGRGLRYEPLPNGKLPAGQVAILFLNAFKTDPPPDIEAPCPLGIVPASTERIPFPGTGLGGTFHVTTSAPVVAYDIFPYGGGNSAATSATLLLPSSVFGTNYTLLTPLNEAISTAPFIQIVASEDGTEVKLDARSPVNEGPGVAAAAVGKTQTYRLSKGQLLQFQQDRELTGSTLLSNKPIGVWAGAHCINIEVEDTACDSAHQQLMPVSALGNEYVAIKHRDRIDGLSEAVPWRILASVDDTILTYEPSPPKDAPLTLKAGSQAIFWTDQEFVVKSQDAAHPIYVSAHMTGCSRLPDPVADCRGDPEFVNVIPPAQFLDSYTFFTDPTYPETNLLLVRKKGPDGMFAPVTLDCLGEVTGFRPIGSYEFARVDLVRHNFEKQGQCDNGRHEIKSTAPFGLTVWGWGSAETGEESSGGFETECVSYAYPAGARIATINSVVMIASPK